LTERRAWPIISTILIRHPRPSRKIRYHQSTIRGWLLLVVFSTALGCSIPEPGKLVVISNPPVFRPKTPQEVKSLEDAIAAVMTVCSKDLGLPVVEPYYLHLYKDDDSYASYSGPTRLPKFYVEHTLAQAKGNRLHINMEKLKEASWGTLVRYMAHEYAHNVEDILSGAQGRSEWVREGFADWVAAKVMDILGWEIYSSSLARAKRAVSRYSSLLPKPAELENNDDWDKIVKQAKWKATSYHVAFLAVDKLIERKGIAGMMNYLRSGNFSGSFDLTPNDFQREMEGTIKDLVAQHGARRSGLRAENRPEWKIGYQWRYAVRAPGYQGNSTSEVVREETFDGVPTYLVRTGSNESMHTKETLASSAYKSGEKALIKYKPPLLWLSWPLDVGKEWKINSMKESAEKILSNRWAREIVITGVEEVLVPAGVFQAFKIETYDSETGELIFEEWYAPSVKWYVKSKYYRDEGVIERELVSFKVD
jgi:hypothetical protein